jgi:hypothetical protein
LTKGQGPGIVEGAGRELAVPGGRASSRADNENSEKREKNGRQSARDDGTKREENGNPRANQPRTHGPHRALWRYSPRRSRNLGVVGSSNNTEATQ